MENQIFRKKSLDRVSSPEQLNDYVRVSNPGVWMVLVAVIMLLVGVCIWGVFGRLDTKISAAAIVESGSVTCYVKEADFASVKTGQTVIINDKECEISAVSSTPIAVTAEFGEYVLHVGGLQVGEWVYQVTFQTDLADGIYSAQIVVDSVSPMSFILN